jgi:hypothetical protein
MQSNYSPKFSIQVSLDNSMPVNEIIPEAFKYYYYCNGILKSKVNLKFKSDRNMILAETYLLHLAQ